MKTITEFPGPNIKNALRIQQEFIVAGKTPEELQPAMAEALKIEGEKLTNLLAALEIVGQKTQDLKRVVVVSLGEGEKAPANATQKGELYFVAEYYPPLHPEKPKKGEFPFRGKRGKGKKGGRRGRRPHDRGKGPRGTPEATSAPTSAKP